MKPINNLLITSTAAVLLYACSSGPAIQQFPSTASSAEEIQKLDADVKSAASLQVDVLSPENFKKANEKLEDSKKRQADGKDSKRTLELVATGRAYLNQANSFSKLSHTNMEEVIEARKLAIEAGAPTLFASDFKKADENLRDVTQDIENNDVKGAARYRAALQSEYRAVELKAIQQTHVGPSIEVINLAKKEDAEKYAPRSLAIAEKNVKDTTAFITGNRHSNSEIAQRSDATLASANHLLKISRNAKAGKNVTGEDAALSMEGEQSKTAAANAALSATVSANQAASASKDALIADEKLKTQEALAQSNQLESEKSFNARFEAAQKLFSKNEAEVYKQDNKLIIRLRGLEFTRSQSDLKGQNFPLLAKVQNVIKDFGKTSVVVEGYTDSDGSKAANEKLSMNRAEAVKEYFVSSAGIDRDSISAVGYGDSKPLAPNNSVKGKAQNRRVDVVITPEETVFTR